jgi:hypothetical protein
VEDAKHLWLPAPPITSFSDRTHLELGNSDYDITAAALGETFYSGLTGIRNDNPHSPGWKANNPSTRSLRLSTSFGWPDINHSFLQEATFETTLILIIRLGFLDQPNLFGLFITHPVVGHLISSIVQYAKYDFRWLCNYDNAWAVQTAIPPMKQHAMMACLLHYTMDTLLLMCFLGHNYTGAHCDTHEVHQVLISYRMDTALISKYLRVMLTGCPNHFVSETTRANALLHWHLRNHPSIDKHRSQVLLKMNKEDRNIFVIPLPH